MKFVRFSERRYFNLIINRNHLGEYDALPPIDNYDLQPVDIYVPSIIVAKEDYYKIDGLLVFFPDIQNQKLFDILRPTEDIFNTGKETVPISANDFKFFEELKIEKTLASTQFIPDSYFLTIKVTLLKDLS